MRVTWRAGIALFIAMTTAAAAADTGSVRGKVEDGAGKGLRGAIVSAIQEDDQKSISVLTDNEGRFVLDQIANRRIQLARPPGRL